ncbi:MAG: spore germination protein GerW family protein [Euryarchaeota archaeon]|nr:spore germination protein GerW family protein [Euryarchaeota archaeon]
MGLEDVMKGVSTELERLVSTKTVFGEPIIAAGKTIIPVSKVSFGFGSGGGEGKKDKGESGFGGGGGAGAKIEPMAFIVISDEEVRLLSISGKSDLGSLIKAVPEVYDKIKSAKERMKRKHGSKTGDVSDSSSTNDPSSVPGDEHTIEVE